MLQLVVLCIAVTFVEAAVPRKSLYVNSGSGSDLNNCLLESFPCKTFSRALSMANPSDTILAQGQFPVTSESSLFPLAINVQLNVAAYPVLSTFSFLCSPSSPSVFAVGLGGDLSLSNAVFQSCPMFALQVAQDALLTVDNATFTGSAVVSVQDQAQATLKACKVSGFQAQTGAANVVSAIRVQGGASLVISNSNLFQNVGAANDYGGVISIFPGGSQLTLTSVTLQNNTGALGGAIYASDATVSMHGTICDSNSASQRGGCIYLTGGTSSLVVGNLAAFRRNAAVLDGGAVTLDQVGGATISETECDGNTASVTGGGCLSLYKVAGVVLVENSTTVSNNVVNLGNGSGIFSFLSNVQISNDVTISGNSATVGFGGAFYVSGGEFSASGLALTGNSVASLGLGAAGYFDNQAVFDMAITALSGNSASEGCVCRGSAGTVSGASLTTNAVICSVQCSLVFNGDVNICTEQTPFPPDPLRSFILGPESVSGVLETPSPIPVQLFDPYDRPTAISTQQMVVAVTRGAILALANVDVVPQAALGRYNVNVTTFTVGDFLVHIKLSGLDFIKSPVKLSISLPGTEPPNLLALWVVLSIVLLAGLVVAGVFLYRRYFRRTQYLPIADGSSSTRHYGGIGFSESEEV